MIFTDTINLDPIAKALPWLSEMNVGTIIIRIVLALLFASILGVERANKRHTAGLRTFILVALGGTSAGLLDLYFTNTYGELFPALSSAVVIGVAIISSRSLLFSSRSQIKGLTTAVGLWSSAFLGLASGAGFYTLSIICFVAIILVLNVLPRLEVFLKNRSNFFEIHLELKNKTDLPNFTAVVRKLGLSIDDIEANPAYANTGLSVYTVSLTVRSKELKKYKTHAEIIEALQSLDYINCIEEI